MPCWELGQHGANVEEGRVAVQLKNRLVPEFVIVDYPSTVERRAPTTPSLRYSRVHCRVAEVSWQCKK